MTAVSCQDPEEDHSAAAFVEGQLLFRSYLKKYGWTEAALPGGISSISLLRSDCSGDYILLAASYQAQLPISFWKIDQLPVEQCVRMKKWTGADPEAAGGAEEGYVYVTPTGERLSQHLRVFLSEAFHTVCSHSRSTGASESGRQHL